MLFISIPTPCHEKWNEMSPGEKGAFCKVCSKTVVDFTSLNDDEVQNYFISNQGKKTCGRFRNDQLTGTDDILPVILAAPLPFWKKFLAIVFIAFGSFLTSCQNDKLGKVKIEGPKASSESFEQTTLGKTLLSPELTITKEKDNTGVEKCSSAMGTPDIVVGDIFTMPVETIKGETAIVIIPDENIDSVSKKMFDENGNEIRKQE